MACSNASQYIQQLASKSLHPLLAPSPRFTPASLMVHAIILSNLTDLKSMPPNTFNNFLQTSLRECTKSDPNMILHELYIFFLFTQILRELMSHLVIDDNSPFFSTLNELQTQIIITFTRNSNPTQSNFQFHRNLPNSDNWIPVNSPSRTRTWVVWPDVPDCTAKQYSDAGWTHMSDIPQDFQQHHYRGEQDMASPEHPLWRTDCAKQQGRPIRRRPAVQSFPFTPTEHPFTTAQADLLHSLLVTLDSITLPEDWDDVWGQNAPRTAWRQKDDTIQGLLQDASSGIIEFWRHLARKGSLPFRGNTTSSIGLISITTLARYLGGIYKTICAPTRSGGTKCALRAEMATNLGCSSPTLGPYILHSKVTRHHGNMTNRHTPIPSSAQRSAHVSSPHSSCATPVPHAH